jgi:hypothetical protein
MGHFHGRIEGLQPGAAPPWLQARLLTESFQAKPAAVEHQLEVTVSPAVQVKSGLAVTAMGGIHGVSPKEWWGCPPRSIQLSSPLWMPL